MSLDQAINLLATVTLIEMMITIGLGVTTAEILGVARNWQLVIRALFASYVCVPVVAVLLLYVLGSAPMVAAGILIAAVCPGAPYGPPLAGLAKGNVVTAVGLMVVLAASSAALAPLLLMLLLPVVAGSESLQINVVKLVGILVLSQFLPLVGGVWLRAKWPGLSERLKGPAGKVCLVLNLMLLVLILSAQFTMLLRVRPAGYLGMFCLVMAAALAGWLLGDSESGGRKTLSISTAVRNVGVALVIATSSFPGTPAIAATTVFAIFQTLLMALVALAWGRVGAGGAGAPKAVPT
jgi:BASS family bile acid:Na+ symporter